MQCGDRRNIGRSRIFPITELLRNIIIHISRLFRYLVLLGFHTAFILCLVFITLLRTPLLNFMYTLVEKYINKSQLVHFWAILINRPKLCT
jgi:hypothetical protein